MNAFIAAIGVLFHATVVAALWINVRTLIRPLPAERSPAFRWIVIMRGLFCVFWGLYLLLVVGGLLRWWLSGVQ